MRIRVAVDGVDGRVSTAALARLQARIAARRREREADERLRRGHGRDHDRDALSDRRKP